MAVEYKRTHMKDMLFKNLVKLRLKFPRICRMITMVREKLMAYTATHHSRAGSFPYMNRLLRKVKMMQAMKDSIILSIPGRVVM